MRGIRGELRFDAWPVDLTAIARMDERLRQCGPDHGGSYSDGALGFGQRWLSIIDLSEHAN
jgi:asparagine synthase (glutamine-hydrolysing)